MLELCLSSELKEGQSLGVSLSDFKVLLVRKFQRIYAYRNSCPHLGVPLDWLPDQFLDDEGELIQCATHGALFTIEDGLCVSGPCVNQSLQPLEVFESEGKIYLRNPPK